MASRKVRLALAQQAGYVSQGRQVAAVNRRRERSQARSQATLLRNARAQAPTYTSLGRAVTRINKTQRALGPTTSGRPQSVVGVQSMTRTPRQAAVQRQEVRQDLRREQRQANRRNVRVEARRDKRQEARKVKRQQLRQAKAAQKRYTQVQGIDSDVRQRLFSVKSRTTGQRRWVDASGLAKHALPAASSKDQIKLRNQLQTSGIGAVDGRMAKDVVESFKIKRSEQQARNLAPANTILREVSRPLHAAAGAEVRAIKAFKKGKRRPDQILAAASKGAYEGAIRNKQTLGSDVVGELGVPKGTARTVLGTGLDFVGDPINLVSFGTGSAVKAGGKAAAKKATKDAARASAEASRAGVANRAASVYGPPTRAQAEAAKSQAKSQRRSATREGKTHRPTGRRARGKTVAPLTRPERAGMAHERRVYRRHQEDPRAGSRARRKIRSAERRAKKEIKAGKPEQAQKTLDTISKTERFDAQYVPGRSGAQRGPTVRVAGAELPGVARATGGVIHYAKRGTGKVTRGRGADTRKVVRQSGSELNATVRPATLTPREFERDRQIRRTATATADRGMRESTRRAQGIARSTTSEEGEEIISALDEGNIGRLRGRDKPEIGPATKRQAQGGSKKLEVAPARARARNRLRRKGDRQDLYTPRRRGRERPGPGPVGARRRAREEFAADPEREFKVARDIRSEQRYLRKTARRAGVRIGEVGQRPKYDRYLLRLGDQIDARDRALAAYKAAPAGSEKQAQAKARVVRLGQEAGATRRRVRTAWRDAGMSDEAPVVGDRATKAIQDARDRTKEAKGYFPRPRKADLEEKGKMAQLAEEVESLERGGGRGSVGARDIQPPAAKRRTRRMARKDLSKEERDALSTDLPAIVADYGTQMARATAGANLNRAVVETGVRLTPKTDLSKLDPDRQAVYHLKGGSLRRLDPVEDKAEIERAQRRMKLQSRPSKEGVSLPGAEDPVYPGRQLGRAEGNFPSDPKRAFKYKVETKDELRPAPVPGGTRLIKKRVTTQGKRIVDPKTGKPFKSGQGPRLTHVAVPRNAQSAQGQYWIANPHLEAHVRGKNAAARSVTANAVKSGIGHWKGVALATPGYLVRNALGDLFNAYTQESSAKLVANYFRAAKVQRQFGKYERAVRDFDRQWKAAGKPKTVVVNGRRVEAVALALEAEAVGAIRSGRLVELGKQTGRISDLRPKRSEGWERARQWVEDQTRLATYIGSRQRGMEPEQAAARVADIHFDYNDLTNAEQFMRNYAMPFYTFTARNTPFQAKALIQRPGKYARIEHARQEGERDANIEDAWKSGVNAYEALQLPIPMRFGKDTYTVSVGLPFTDLNTIAPANLNPLTYPKDYLEKLTLKAADLLGPWVKTPFELALGFSAFYKEPIYQPGQQRMTPVPIWLEKLADNSTTGPAVRKLFGISKAQYKADASKRWSWSKKRDYAFNQVFPGLPGELLGATEAANRRGYDLKEQAIGTLGPRLTRYEPDKAALNRRYEIKTRLEDRRQAFYDRGIYEDDKDPRFERNAEAIKKNDAVIKRIRKRGNTLGPGGVPNNAPEKKADDPWGGEQIGEAEDPWGDEDKKKKGSETILWE